MVQVRQSTIIDAPIEEVWAILRDFNGHDRWHPAIAASEIDGVGIERGATPVGFDGAIAGTGLATAGVAPSRRASRLRIAAKPAR
jgi:hypothetical protein